MRKFKKLLTLTLVALIGITTVPFTANAAPKCQVDGDVLWDPACAKNHKVLKTIKYGSITGWLKSGTYKGKTYVWAKFNGNQNTHVAEVRAKTPTKGIGAVSDTELTHKSYTQGLQYKGRKGFHDFKVCIAEYPYNGKKTCSSVANPK